MARIRQVGTTATCRVLRTIPTKPGRPAPGMGATEGRRSGDIPRSARATTAKRFFLQRVGNRVWHVRGPSGSRWACARSKRSELRGVLETQSRRSWPPNPSLHFGPREGRLLPENPANPAGELGLHNAKMSGRSVKSLENGSAPPGPVPEGLIRVYSMRFCPFAQRTRLVLEAKGIKHEVININLKNKPEWFFKKNPFGLVPVLENSQGQLIYESAITCEYLDEMYPGKKLLPEDPYEKARQKMVFQLFSKVPSLIGSFIRSKNKEDCSGVKEELRKEFSKLEEVLTSKKTTFFGGSSLSMIDYLIWPWFERLEPLELNECVDHTPKLKLWIAAMKKDPTVSALLTDAKTFQGFLNLYLQNSLEAYDYGL